MKDDEQPPESGMFSYNDCRRVGSNPH
jgi:hypothetical protein